MGEYRDYAAKVAAAMGTPEISDELVREHQATGIADYLCSERNRQGLSQRDVAKRMGVSASKICRIEDSYDRDLAYADIMSYATALGIEPKLAFENPNASVAERSEGLVYRIADLLQKLRKLVPESGLQQEAIDDFSGRVLFPFFDSSMSGDWWRHPVGFGGVCSQSPLSACGATHESPKTQQGSGSRQSAKKAGRDTLWRSHGMVGSGLRPLRNHISTRFRFVAIAACPEVTPYRSNHCRAYRTIFVRPMRFRTLLCFRVSS